MVNGDCGVIVGIRM